MTTFACALPRANVEHFTNTSYERPMSTKRPDVLRNPPAPETCLTVGEMWAAGWQLKACCRKCGLSLRVNVSALVKAYGPEAVWWGRSQECPRFDSCPGKLTYSARSISGGTWKSLEQPAPERVVEAWKWKRVAPHRPPRDG